MKILLAIDGSYFSEQAVEEIIKRPWPADSVIKIISVVEPMATMMAEAWVLPETYWNGVQEVATEQAQDAINKAVARIKQAASPSLVIKTEILKGYAKNTILDEAARWGADLIILGSHGYRGFKRILLGSVSQAVASHAKCSVEIVRNRMTGAASHE